MTGYTTGKPTIQELEALLNDQDSPPVAITPDGRVVPASMIDRIANQVSTNQIIIQIGDLAEAVEALEASDIRWNQVARYLASALVTAETIK